MVVYERPPYPKRAEVFFFFTAGIGWLFSLYYLTNLIPAYYLGAKTGYADGWRPLLSVAIVPVVAIVLGAYTASLSAKYRWQWPAGIVAILLSFGTITYCVSNTAQLFHPEMLVNYGEYRLYQARLPYKPGQKGYVPFRRQLNALAPGEEGFVDSYNIYRPGGTNLVVANDAKVDRLKVGDFQTRIRKIDTTTCLVVIDNTWQAVPIQH